MNISTHAISLYRAKARTSNHSQNNCIHEYGVCMTYFSYRESNPQETNREGRMSYLMGSLLANALSASIGHPGWPCDLLLQI